MAEIRALCVYCGSSSGDDGEQEDFARAFGSACAARGIELIFGAGGTGLMGAVADAALAGGGRVVGIIPRSLVESEPPLPGLTELVVVDSMHERKQQMFHRADGFVSLPGGFGTLDETLEVLTWRQLGFHDKPIVLANCRGFWNPLLSLFDHIVAEGFAQTASRDLYAVADSVDGVFDRLAMGAAARMPAPSDPADQGSAGPPGGRALAGGRPSLLHGDRLGKVAGLVHIAAAQHRRVVGEELEGH